MPPTGQAPQYDTPIGVGGQINNNTGQVLTGALAGAQAGINNPNTGTGYTLPASSTPPPTLSATHLGTQATPFNVQPTATQTPPNVASLLAQFTTPNAQENQDTNNVNSLTSQINALIGKSGTESQVQGQLNESMGVNQLHSQLQDINNQIMTLNNQAFAATQTAEGRQAPQFAINGEQAQIQRQKAVQMYGLSAAASVLQGQYSDAQAKVQAALDNEFKPIQSAIQQYQNLLSNAKDQLSSDQKAKADQINASLSELDKQVQQQQADKQTAYALMMAALKNNPGNPQVQMAFNQANQLSVSDPNYLTKVMQLVGQYQSDPIATQQALAQLGLTKAQTAKIYNDLSTSAGNGSTLAQSNLRTTTSGIQYVDGTNLTGKDAQQAQLFAAQNGVPYLDKTAADLQNNVETARQNMTNIANTLEGLLPTSGLRVDQKLSNMLQSATQIGGSADALASFNAYRSAAIQALRAMAGAKGLRINQAEIMQSVNQDIPKITDTVGVAKAKIAIVNSLLDSQEKGTFGSQFYQPQTTTAEPTDHSVGAKWVRPDGTYVSDGKQWVKQ